MDLSDRDDAYRAALGAAQVEMNEILNQFEKLHLRRTQMEQVAAALRPLIEIERQVVSSDERTARVSNEPDYQAAPRAVPQVSSDPLQRQIDYVLGKAAVA
jgi:hypothetical protein